MTWCPTRMIYDHCLRNKKLMKNKKVLITDASIMEHSRLIKILEISKSHPALTTFLKQISQSWPIVLIIPYGCVSLLIHQKLKSCSKLERIKIRLKTTYITKEIT
jgi:hypothetical protein